MAKFDGKFLEGAAGSLVFKKRNGKQIVQARPRQFKQTSATKKSATEFGKSSGLSKNIRWKLAPLYYQGSDGAMVNRLTKEINFILRQCYDPSTNTYTFESESFSRLNGFNFNIKSPFQNSVLIHPQVTIENDVLRASFSELQIPAQLKIPAGSALCVIEAWGIAVALQDGYITVLGTQQLEVPNKKGPVPDINWDFALPEGCLGMIAFAIKYYEKSGSYMLLMNDRDFYPAAISGAIYNPGTFDVPNLENWENMHLKFPAL